MKMSSAPSRSLRFLAPAFLMLSLVVPRALAVTNDELLPENLVGKTFRFTHNAATPNTLEPAVNSYAITFNTASTYTRTGAGLPTINGTYSVSITAIANAIRLTNLLMNNWTGTAGTPLVSLSLTHAAGIGGFAANEALNPLKNSGGLFTIDGSPGGGGGGGGPTAVPTLAISNPTVTGTVGTAFTYQISATQNPTSYGSSTLPGGLTLNTSTGLISGTPTTAGTFNVTISASNALGSGAAPITITINAAPGGGGGSGGGGSTGTPATAVRAWGWNLSGQTSVPAGLTNVTQLAGSSQAAFALRADGSVVAWGQNTQTTVPAGAASGVTALAAGSSHVLALKSDGSLVQWGNTADGQRNGFPTSGTFTAISAAYFQSMAVRSDGTVAVWGVDPAFPPLAQPPAGLTGVRSVAAGVGYGLALKTDGTVVGWNSTNATYLAPTTDKGQSRPPAGLSGVVAIAAGQFHALALRSDGVVIGWGGSRNGAAGTFSIPQAAQNGVIAIACGLEHSLVLKSDGTVVAWGNNGFGETVVPAGLTGVTRIAAGEYFSLAATGGTAPAPGGGTGGGGGGGGGGGTPTFAAAPANLVGYRNRVGQVFEFTVTGSNSGAVWGTDVYTDDSSVARAAVHAGVLAVGETKAVAITILPGQQSYAASTRYGVTTSQWGAWSGSFAFAGAGTATGGTPATARPAAAPGFVAGTGALAAGSRFVCPVNVTGGGTYTYQWFLNGLAIAGATANPYVVASVTAANAGTYTVDVTNSLGTTRITAGSLTVGAAGSPVIALQPISKTVVPGATVTFAVSATGTGLSYQWFRNNVQLAGETGAVLLRSNVSAADAGTYTARITNSAGSVTSSGGTLTLSAAASRPANISVRTNVATGTIVTPGFVIQGAGTKRVLIRAVGPGLAAFNVPGTMADPKFTVFQGQSQIATNDDWAAGNIGQAFAATGAFTLPAGSKDAALVTDLAAGRDYTVQVTNATGTGGIVLIEVYDADALTGTSTSKLVNVSVRGQTAPGADVLTLGLVVQGIGQRTLLVRGVGPTLASFGVTGTVADPRLQIFDSQSRPILANDDWASADFVSELALASNYVGAFALANGSRDAATLTLLDPGAYTIQVSGAAAAPTGEALVEVYEVP
ncbi:MAG: putative Ig domain-containing protein [Opitutaceae bacterium]|nr:putative Ig domain-containing protein [Opitutaceae bacterium]